tara:strand:- start:201 stop:1034 length:834 start_codon:yes stop_codon:yes gene_type:complete
MKITKSQLKQIIVEEIGTDPAMMKAINKLTDSIEGLDVSIDYLTSAVTGEDPFTVGSMQKALGRFATPHNKKGSLDEGHGGEGSMAVRQLNNLSQMVQELQAMVDESDDHEEWVESKITKAHDYINTVLNYLSGADPDFDPVNERVYQAGEQRPIDIIKGDLQELLTCYMQELETMGHDADLIAFGMKRVISDIQISGGKGSQCDSVAVRPTVDPTDVPYRRVAERELTDAEEDEKEDIVKGMKKNKKDFKKRYGKDAENVMYGAATNIAKKNRGKK